MINQNEFCSVLKLLSNPNRFLILQRLLQGETSVGELESELNLKQPNLSHELSRLRQHNIVRTRRQSKVIFYSMNNGPMKNLINDIVALHISRLNSSTDEATAQQSLNPSSSLYTIIRPNPSASFPRRSLGECSFFSTAKQR